MRELEVGNKVSYGPIGRGGSIGVVDGKRTDGPFEGNPAYYVTWHYGLDSRGEQVTMTSGFYGTDRYILEKIPDETFAKHITRRFNSGSCPCGCMKKTA